VIHMEQRFGGAGRLVRVQGGVDRGGAVGLAACGCRGGLVRFRCGTLAFQSMQQFRGVSATSEQSGPRSSVDRAMVS